jgi:hypothetical protein
MGEIPIPNGDPIALRAPVLEEMEKLEILSDELLAAYKKLPAESIARKFGVPLVFVRGRTSVKDPVLETVNSEMSFSPAFAT